MHESTGARGAARALVRKLKQRSPVVSRRSFESLARRLHDSREFATFAPPGHFYSPYPDLADFERRAGGVLSPDTQPVHIDLREDEQLALFRDLAAVMCEAPFPDEPGDEFRYHLDNPAYAWGDGLVLHAMLRHLRPRRVIEVGSGYSSAMILDTTERYLDPGVEVVYIEPHDELLRSLLRPDDAETVTVLHDPVQDVDPEIFATLAAGDVLFIDSTHVVKAASDVNHLYFEVLPRLAPGVVVHVHDIFFPFEYPADWVRERRAWQEAYLLRAFLMYNDAFRIEWFQHLMWCRHHDELAAAVPAIARNPGANLWLRKVA